MDKAPDFCKEYYEVPEMRRIRRIHFIGIGGAGMSGIADSITSISISKIPLIANLTRIACYLCTELYRTPRHSGEGIG